MSTGHGVPMQDQSLPVNPALLRWARLTAGLSVQDAVQRAKITPPRQHKGEPPTTAEDRLASWEAGDETPALQQLEALAKAYRRPLVTFFLSEPPAQVAPLADYRTVQDTPPESPEFAALKRRIFLLHRELRAIAADEQAEALPFVGSCTVKEGVDATADAIRTILGITPVAGRRQSAEDVFRSLRDKAHEAGVYVVLMGDLGSHHSKVRPEEFRGIALADAHAPLVVINKYDAKPAMPFTLAHELAHIFLGNSGISNQNAFGFQRTHKAVERFCNAVAAELLVPAGALRAAWHGGGEELTETVKPLARNFGVSEEVIARRLFDLDFLTEADFKALIRIYRGRWQRIKEKNKESGGGPGANALAHYYLGAKTLATLSRAADAGLITLQDAARTLNMSVARFEKVAG